MMFILFIFLCFLIAMPKKKLFDDLKVVLNISSVICWYNFLAKLCYNQKRAMNKKKVL